ncbi:MAG: DUF4238 domain-containing protein [Candidatus Nitrosocosmicus sp.]
MKKARKQHFIPRFYLENFTFDRNREKIYCYDKVQDKSYICNIKDIGQENDFYEISGVTNNEFEKSISIFEGSICSPAYNTLLVNRNFELSLKDKENLFLCLAFQHIRSNDDRYSINELSIKIRDELIRVYGNTAHVQDSINNLEKQKALHLATVFNENTDKDIQKKANLFLSRKWSVLTNAIQDRPFIISDNPLAFSNLNRDDNVAFMLEGSKIHFPLSSNLILYSDCNNSQTLTSNRATEVEVTEANTAQIKSSSRFIYQNNDNFDFVQKFLSRYPKFRKQYRAKYVVSIKNNILTTKLID